MAYACPRAAVVENRDLGHERPLAHPHSSAMKHVLDGLLEPDRRQPAQMAVPAGERHWRRQNQGAVRHYDRPAESSSTTDFPTWAVNRNNSETPVIAAPYLDRPHHISVHIGGTPILMRRSSLDTPPIPLR
jgi:hypothetical protein